MIVICFLLNELNKLSGIIFICSTLKFSNCSLENDWKTSRGKRAKAWVGKKFINSGGIERTSVDRKPADSTHKRERENQLIFLEITLTSNGTQWTKDMWSKKIRWIDRFRCIEHNGRVIDIRFNWTFDICENGKIRSKECGIGIFVREEYVRLMYLNSSGGIFRRRCSSITHRICPAFSKKAGVKRWSIARATCARYFN